MEFKRSILDFFFQCGLILGIFTLASCGPGQNLLQVAALTEVPTTTTTTPPAATTGVLGKWVDSSGNFIITDTNNHRLRKVTASTGIISNFAGTGTNGNTGNGGPAVDATIGFPAQAVIDSAGNVYVVNEGYCEVRKIDANTGNISLVAGDGSCGTSGGDGSAVNAEIRLPPGIAVDSSFNVYIAEAPSNVIRKVDFNSGNISTVVGTFGFGGYSGDNGPATLAKLEYPSSLIIDSTGNIFVSDVNVIRKVTAGGVITTYAGVHGSGNDYSGDGGPATLAHICAATGLALDSVGNLYIADRCNNVIRKVEASTGIITTYAGMGLSSSGYSGDGGSAVAAQLNGPTDVAFDLSGNLYISDSGNHCIRKVTAATGVISRVAGVCQSHGSTGDGDLAINALFYNPFTDND